MIYLRRSGPESRVPCGSSSHRSSCLACQVGPFLSRRAGEVTTYLYFIRLQVRRDVR